MLDTQRARSLERRAADAFEEAARTAGLNDRTYRLAGRTIRLRFAGSALADPLTRALHHLERTDRDEPELTIHIWDAGSTGSTPPPIPSSPPGATTSPMHLYRTERGRGLGQPVEGALSVVQHEGARAWYWVRDASALPFYELAAPFRHILAAWLGPRGCTLVHAAGVGTREGGVLLVGRGGSGKSTSALACLGSSLRYAADDYLLVEGGVAHTLYSSGKLRPDSLELLPHLRPLVDNLDRVPEEKAVLYLDERRHGELVAGFPVAAVVACRIGTGTGTRVERISPAAALAALAPSTILQLPGSGQDALDAMAALIALVPTFSLDLPPDPSEVPGAVAGILDRTRGAA
jgi:hypothetical protein